MWTIVDVASLPWRTKKKQVHQRRFDAESPVREAGPASRIGRPGPWGHKMMKGAQVCSFKISHCPIYSPKFNMEPENDGFQKESPFPGTSFQVPC